MTSKQFGWSFSSRRCVVRGQLASSELSLGWIGVVLLAIGVAFLPMHAFSQQIAPVWVVSSLAGSGTATPTTAGSPDKGDGGPALQATMGKPLGLARDKVGNLYFAEANSVIRKVTPAGVISVVAGTSNVTGFSGDGGPATSALLKSPYGVSIDKDGNLLIGDEANEVIRKINLVTGIITTVAGTGGKAGFSGDGGPATSATLTTSFGAVGDQAGNIYIADYGNHRIRKVDTNGIITTFAGTGTAGFTGDGGPATKAELSAPYNVWLDPAGDLYICDVGGGFSRVRMIDTSGIIHTIAGIGTAGYSGDGGPATSAKVNTPHGAVIDGQGNTYITDETNHIIRWVNPSGIITTIGGVPTQGGFAGDGGPATAGKFDFPYGLAIDSSNNLYIPDAGTYRLREMSLNTGLPSTAVGASATQNLFVASNMPVTPSAATLTPASSGEFAVGILSGCSLGTALVANTPCTVPINFQPAAPGLQTVGLSFTDASGNVSAIGLSGVGVAPQADFGLAAITTIAGNGTAGNVGTTGPAAAAQVSAPRGGVIDSAGNIYFADSGNNVIRRIDAASGAISTVAGTGTAGYVGDGSAATAAQLNAPAKVVLDAAGNLYIADTNNNVIRFVDATTGDISTIAGTGTSSYTGDAGAATSATLNRPQGLAVDLGGHIYVADTGNNVIRYFGRGGQISTLTGTGTAGYSGDGGNAYGAELNAPEAVALDQSGDVYIADTGNDVVRMISPANQISTFAGQQGNSTNAGDGGAATAAALAQPSDITLDAAGDLYIASGGQVRMVNPSGVISTLAGTGATGSYSGEGGSATSAVIPAPASNLMLDSAGDIVIAATDANRLLKVDAATPMFLNLGIQAAGTTGPPTTFSVLNTGNSALNISGITATAGFTLQTGGASACTATTSLAPGQACLVSIVFSPGSTANGAVSGTLTLTDNALNGTNVAEIFALAGATKLIPNTTTSIGISPVSPLYGSPATITATVSNGSSPTGTVNFIVNGSSIGSTAVNKNQATIALPILPVGIVKVEAIYSGDATNGSSASSTSVTIQPVVLTVKATNATIGLGTSVQSLTYTITGFVNGDTSSIVTGAPAETTPAGPTSPQGTYPITITQGTLAVTNYTFTFVNATLTVGPPPTPDFLLSVTPTQASIPGNQPYVATLTLIPLYNYKGTVKISCTSAPVGLGCIAVGPLTGGGGPLAGNGQGVPVYTQITISSPGASSNVSTNNMPSKPQQLWLALGVPICFFGLVFSKGRKGRLPARLLGLLLLTITTLGVTSCSKSASSARALGTYQVTITATDTASSSVSHSITMALTFQ